MAAVAAWRGWRSSVGDGDAISPAENHVVVLCWRLVFRAAHPAL
jgi:hypothetical protein